MGLFVIINARTSYIGGDCMKTLSDLFFTFFRIGAVTFGGGYSMLPILQKETVEKKQWVTESDLLDYYAIGQCLPGIIAVNTSIFIGYKVNKTSGSVAASLGVITPSIIVITIIAMLISNFADIPAVQYAFNGIRIAVAALITEAVIKLFRTNIIQKKQPGEKSDIGSFLKRNWLQLFMCISVFLLVAFWNVSAAYVVVGAALFGVVYGIVMKGGAQ